MIDSTPACKRCSQGIADIDAIDEIEKASDHGYVVNGRGVEFITTHYSTIHSKQIVK